MAVKRRYYADDDQMGKTPSAFKRLSRAKQAEYMRHWFFQNFEDPVEQTPYETAEGGYQYIFGGPYKASDELWNEFGHLVSATLIDEVVDEVEKNGVNDWAPGDAHPDKQFLQDDEEFGQEQKSLHDIDTIIEILKSKPRITLGDGYERQLRQEAIEALRRLKDAVPVSSPQYGGIGHNNPPPDFEPIDVQPAQQIQQITESILSEIAKPEVDALAVVDVAKDTKRLKILGEWLAKKGDIFADSVVTTAGAAAVGLVATAMVKAAGWSPEISHLVSSAFSSLCHWLGYVSSAI